jgi:glycosyltransferase involved in cell wall biosynthesis
MPENNPTTSKIIPAVIILTYNEEINLPHALQSVGDWTPELYVVDSGSTDSTCDIVRKHGVGLYSHPFLSYAEQRNWALENVPFKSEWVLFLDADEMITPEAKAEIESTLGSCKEDVRGFYIPFLYIFLGVGLRRTMHPHLRLVRRDARWVKVNKWREFSTISTPCPTMKCRFVHHCRRGLAFLLSKFNNNTSNEARYLIEKRRGQKAEQAYKRGELKLRHKVWNAIEGKLPTGARALAFFGYNIFARLEPRAGITGLIFLFIYGLWYPLMIDAKMLEIKRAEKDAAKGKNLPGPAAERAAAQPGAEPLTAGAIAKMDAV